MMRGTKVMLVPVGLGSDAFERATQDLALILYAKVVARDPLDPAFRAAWPALSVERRGPYVAEARKLLAAFTSLAPGA